VMGRFPGEGNCLTDLEATLLLARARTGLEVGIRSVGGFCS
jgi:hypothetical protein